MPKYPTIAKRKGFGEEYQSHIRLCFAGEPPERLEIVIDRLNNIIER